MQTYEIGLNFVDSNSKYETFLWNNECWRCGHLGRVYILLEHLVHIMFITIDINIKHSWCLKTIL